MLKGYTDAHVVFGLVQALRRRGMDVVRVQDCGREEAEDADLLAEALANERVLLTNDTDFLVLAAERGARQERFAPIFFWPQQRLAPLLGPAVGRQGHSVVPFALPLPGQGEGRGEGRTPR